MSIRDIEHGGGAGICEAVIPVVGLRPGKRNPETGEIIEDNNLRECRPDLLVSLKRANWFKPLLRDVRKGDKSAIAKLALGSIVVVAVIGAGYKFGVPDAVDLRNFKELFNKKPKSGESSK